MHEFSLAEGVLEIVLDTARDNSLTSVADVRLDVGKLSGVSIDAVRFAWEFLSNEHDLTKGAQLSVNEPPGRGLCQHCGFDGPIDNYLRICPSCGGGGLRFTSGEEFTVTGITGE